MASRKTPRNLTRARASSSNMPSRRVSQAYNEAAAASAERRETIDALMVRVQNAIQTCEPLPYNPALHASNVSGRSQTFMLRPQDHGSDHRASPSHPPLHSVTLPAEAPVPPLTTRVRLTSNYHCATSVSPAEAP